MRVYVCLLACLDRPLTVNERIQIFHEDRYREACEGYRVGDPERKRLKLKHAWHWFVLVSASTDDGSPLTGGPKFNMDGG